MITEILPASDMASTKAAELLKQGEIVAVPTETVYGLAGDARNPDAIEKIFLTKGRPQDNPLIVHISNFDMLYKVAKFVNDDAIKLAKSFWPGPLTIIVPKSDYICDKTCAGLDSVGVRMPSNNVARNIIEKCGFPFAAPSANLSGKPSPTNIDDVKDDLFGKVPLIIDGGDCDAGVESTVVSVLEDTPIILRPGIVTAKQMEKVLDKPVKIAKSITSELKNDEKVLSPGMKYKHYAPKAEITIIKGSLENVAKFVNNHIEKDTFVLCFEGEEKYFNLQCVTYGKENDDLEQAHKLFTSLRKLDRLGAKKVYARCPNDTGVALAVYNRLIRSAGFKVVEV